MSVRPLAPRTVAGTLAILVACSLLAAPALARTWSVPLELPSIQAGIDAAAAGDTVVVACGTYFEFDIALKGGVTIRSASGEASCVTVDAQEFGRVFDLDGAVEPVVIEGLTITGGQTPDGWLEAMGGGLRVQNAEVRVASCVFTANTARIGAGMGIYRSVVEIENCIFLANTSAHHTWAAGGGIWCFESSGVLDHVRFEANTAFSDNPDDPGDGGAVLCNGSQLQVNDCEFIANATGGGGGGYYSLSLDSSALVRCHFEGNSAKWGGAMYFEFSSLATVDEGVFLQNTAGAGGALIIDPNCRPIFRNTLFMGNTATSSSGGGAQCWASSPLFYRCHFDGNSSATEGGALFLGGAGARVEESLFTGNSAAIRGGAVHYKTSTTTLLKSTFVGNSAPSGSTVFAADNARPTLRRSIVAFAPQGSAVAADATGSIALTCSNLFGNVDGDWTAIIADQLGINGNLSADPLFVDAEGGDFRIACSSPCAPGQTGSCLLIGAFPADCPIEEPVAVLPASALAPSLTIAPNPFNAHTAIAFTLPLAGPVHVVIIGLDGRRIRTLASGPRSAGTHRVVWDGLDHAGRGVASGTYLCRVMTSQGAVTAKLGLVK